MTQSPWGVTAAFLILHLALAAMIDLIDDEAYYLLWASAPAWGYFDHPPVIAWMIAASVAIAGESPFGTRLIPVLSMATVTPMVWRMVALAGGAMSARFLAALLYNTSLLMLALSSFATPDAPLLLFWTATLWAMTEALNSAGQRRRLWWLAAGLALGLCIMSKLTGLFLAVGLLGWLLATRPGRAAFFEGAIWAGAAVSLAVLAPFLWWNLTHDWLGLERQFSRITVGKYGLDTLVAFVVSTTVLFSPIGIWIAFRGVGTRWPGHGLLLWSTAPIFLYLLWHSLQHRVEANWIAPIHPALAVAAGIGAAGLRPLWPRLSVGLGLGLGLPALLALFLWPTPIIRGHNPPNQIRGWAEAEAEIRAAATDAGAAWIATESYALTGQLWHRLSPDIPVWAVAGRRRYLFRGHMPSALCEETALHVRSLRTSGPDVTELFRQGEPIGEMERRQGDTVLERYALSVGRGLRDCPR